MRWLVICAVFLLLGFPVSATGQTLPADSLHSANAGTAHRAADSGFITDKIEDQTIDLQSLITIDHYLKRLTGVRRDPDGNFVFRGLGEPFPQSMNISLNGQRLANTGGPVRLTDVSGFSADIFEFVEFRRIISAADDASSTQGILNLQTKQPTGGPRSISLITSGGLHGGESELLNPDTRFVVNYGDSFEEGSILLQTGLYQNRSALSFGQVEIGRDIFDFGNGVEDVIRYTTPSLSVAEQNNMGGYLNVSIHPGQLHSWEVSAFANTQSAAGQRHQLEKNTEGDWLSPTETGQIGNRGTMHYRLNALDQSSTQSVMQITGMYKPGNWQLRYRGGWSYGGTNGSDLFIPFRALGLNFEIDPSNPQQPTLTNTGQPVRNNNLLLQEMNEVRFDNTNHQLNTGADADFQLGDLKLTSGIGFLRSANNSSYRQTFMRLLANANVGNFPAFNENDIRVLGNENYTLGTLLTPDGAKGFVSRNFSVFRKESRDERLNSDVFNYESAERIYAGYISGSYQLNSFHFMLGVRAEYTDAEYTGRTVHFDNIGNHVSTADTTSNSRYLNFFPNVQVRYQPDGNFSVEAGYSRTIARQDFRQLSPFRLRHVERQTLSLGNPSLDPVLSDNLDLIISLNPIPGTSLTIGGFVRQLSGLVFGEVSSDLELEEETITVTTFENLDETATVAGVEISVSQKMSFLPGLLSNIHLFGNYAWTSTSFRSPLREERQPLLSQSPHIANASIGYFGTRFSGLVSLYYVSGTVTDLADTAQNLPAMGLDIFADTEVQAYSQVDVSLRYQLFPNLQLHADALNLAGRDQVAFKGSADLYPTRITSAPNQLFQLGLRLDF